LIFLDPSDKSSSLGVLYGSSHDVAASQFQPITIKPHRYIEQLITAFESPFQFVPKGTKFSDGWVETKMKPPSAKRLVLVEELTLGTQFAAENLNLKYTFKVKGLDTSGNEINVKKRKTVVEQSFTPKEYLLTKDHLNHETIEAKIEEALLQVATGF